MPDCCDEQDIVSKSPTYRLFTNPNADHSELIDGALLTDIVNSYFQSAIHASSYILTANTLLGDSSLNNGV